MDLAPAGSGKEAGLKDAVLNALADTANVAQFVSFAPGPDAKQRFSRIRGYDPNHLFASLEDAVRALIASSPEGSVNIRSFRPDRPKDNEFLYALTHLEDVARGTRRLASAGFYTIVNETVDVNDGGVSGVAYAGILEFVPGDTPRGVEKPGTMSIGHDDGIRMLTTVYGFSPDLGYRPSARVEFSVHPLSRGLRDRHTIIWEVEGAQRLNLAPDLMWPNRFSRMVGDKAFGLLVADLLDLPVPATTVIARAVAPFRFGRPTGTGEPWIRTCPAEQVPGLFTTRSGWTDPFRLLADEDTSGEQIASVLSQEGVTPAWSGALAVGSDGALTIEGVEGRGDTFMQGEMPPQRLPASVLDSVTELHRVASRALGPVRMEWVYDGLTAWVLQLHKGPSPSSKRVVYPGNARVAHRFDVSRGIAELRKLIDSIEKPGEGVTLVGDVGITSHMGDLLRRARIPSTIEAAGE